MSNNVETAVLNHINDNASGVTKGTNLFRGIRRNPGPHMPKRAVFVRQSLATRPLRSMGQVSEIKFPLLVIEVRSDNYVNAEATARTVMDSLQGASINGYLDVELLNSHPTYSGQDNNGNHIMSLDIELTYEASA